jgi:hypothetical protein
MNHDVQSNFAGLVAPIALVQASEGAEYFVESAEIDTQGFDSLGAILSADRAITGTDDIKFTVLESDTSGGTFTEVASDKLLPEYAQEADGSGIPVTEQTSPYKQVLGVTQTKQFIKLRLNGIVIDTTNITFDIAVFLKAYQRPFAEADPNFPSDGKP